MRTNLHVGPSCRVITTNGVTFCFIDAVPKNLRSKEYKTPKCLKANVFKIVNIIVLNTELAYLVKFLSFCMPLVFAARCYAQARGLCRHAVSICLSVCVRHVRELCQN